MKQCAGEVRMDGMAFTRWRPCRKKSTTVVDGVPYCAVHDPSKAQERADAKSARWEAKWDTQRRAIALDSARYAVVAAARAWRSARPDMRCDDCEHPECELSRAVDAYVALLRQPAEGTDVRA